MDVESNHSRTSINLSQNPHQILSIISIHFLYSYLSSQLISSQCSFPVEMLFAPLSYLLLASAVYGRVLTQDKRAVDPAVYQLIIDDQIRADAARPEPTPDSFIFSLETVHSVISNDIDGPGKRDLSLRETDRPATDEPESRGDGSIGTSRLRSNGKYAHTRGLDR